MPTSSDLIDLFLTIKRDVEDADGSWNGGDVVQVLTRTFSEAGIDVERGPEQFGEPAAAALARLVTQESEAAGFEREAVAVVFCSTEWDNGYFLDEASASVHFADGASELADFGPAVKDVLTDLYGVVGRNAIVGVSLRSGHVEFQEVGTRESLLHLLL